MTKKEKNKLTMLLFFNGVAGSRNVKAIDRLEALHIDIARMIEGEEPTATKELV